MWAVMMVAMMVPTAAPMTLMYGEGGAKAPRGGSHNGFLTVRPPGGARRELLGIAPAELKTRYHGR